MNMSMKSNNRKDLPPASKDFFKALEDRYNSITQSRVEELKIGSKMLNSTLKGKQNKEKCNKKNKQKAKNVINFLDLTNTVEKQQYLQQQNKYTFNHIVQCSQQFSQTIVNILQKQKPKFTCIQVQNLSSCPTTKIQQFSHLIQNLLKQFQKALICIYSLTEDKSPQFYDMLSIRRQLKNDSNLLVQTNICNNAKTGIILKKLIDVAKQRQKAMQNDGIKINAVVFKIKGVISGQKQNQENKQLEMEISSGGFGEIGNKCLMGLEKMRVILNVVTFGKDISSDQIKSAIKQYQKPVKQQTQSELLFKIKILQEELNEKKKELEQEKQRIEKEQIIKAQIDHLCLPSHRPIQSTDKFSTKIIVGSRKQSHA